MEYNVYIMEYYSATKKKEMMPFGATWMDLGEVSQIEKEKYCMTSLMFEILGEKNDPNELS